MRSILLCLFLASTLCFGQEAQGQRVRPYPLKPLPTWQKAVDRETRDASGSPGKQYWSNYAQYKIRAKLLPEKAWVQGNVEIIYHNRSPRGFRDLHLHLRQNLHAQGSMRNEVVEITGGMKVENILVNGKPLSPLRVKIEGSIMKVQLPRRLRAGAKVTLSMDYSFKVPSEDGAPRMGHQDKQVYFLAYWYPQMAVRDDVNGWVADPYMGRSEFYMGYGDYDLEFTAPVGWLLRATGSLQNPEEVLTEQARARLAQVAESDDTVSILTAEDLAKGQQTQQHESGLLTWKFQAQNVRDCAVSLSDRYLWDATSAVVEDKRCMIHAVYQSNARGWQHAAKSSKHVIEFTSKLLGPYPWPQMTSCQGIVGGGMEYPMMTLIGVTGGKFDIYSIHAHELIHMWFPMQLGSNEKRYAWMDEGLTTYCTSLAEVDFWNHPRMLNRSLAEYRMMMMFANADDLVCMQHGDAYPSEMAYQIATYGKAAAVLHQLQHMLGDEVFFKALKEYVDAWRYKHPYPEDLFAVFNRVSGQDLNWYFRTWFYESWWVDQAIKSVECKEDETLVVLEDLGMATHPTVLLATYGDGRTETVLVPVSHWLSGKRSKELRLATGIKRLQIDPAGRVLDKSRNNNVWSAPESEEEEAVADDAVEDAERDEVPGPKQD